MYENLFTENFYCAKVSVATRVMALYKYFKPILPHPNGDLPGSISASQVAAMNNDEWCPYRIVDMVATNTTFLLVFHCKVRHDSLA